MRILVLSALALLTFAQDKGDRVLFDFERDEDVCSWMNSESARKEPPVKIEFSDKEVTSGRKSLKLTYSGGHWPTIWTPRVPGDWTPWKTLACEVTVARSCLIGFQVIAQKSVRGEGWDAGMTCWTVTEFLKPGRNDLRMTLESPEWNGGGLNPKAVGTVRTFEIFFYTPHSGETIHIDNLRLLRAPSLPHTNPFLPQSGVKFRVLGTDLEVSGVAEIREKLHSKWKRAESRSVDQVEADFKAHYEKLKAKHPKAVLATFRDGENGYSGWRDAYIDSHSPDSNTAGRERNTGSTGVYEVAAIPTGSTILAAQFILVADDAQFDKERDPRSVPTMWVAEACNRPWVESDVNAYRYAKDKFWKQVGGAHYGDDPDFLPIYLAHGPGNAPVSTWDFTQAVKFWTDGKHDNNGFFLHGDSYHYMGQAHYRESKSVRSRPALLVVYEPRS